MAKRLTKDALLFAVALILHVVEAQIPSFIPVPGVKLGLANIVTVWAMFRTGPKDTLAVMILRVLLGSLFGGQIISFVMSLSGAVSCYILMLLIYRFFSVKQIWVVSVLGALAHNAGQILAAVLLFQTMSVAVYLPFLVLSGILTGLFTGLTAQLLDRYLPRKSKEE